MNHVMRTSLIAYRTAHRHNAVKILKMWSITFIFIEKHFVSYWSKWRQSSKYICLITLSLQLTVKMFLYKVIKNELIMKTKLTELLSCSYCSPQWCKYKYFFACLCLLFQTFYFISFLVVVVYAWKSKKAIQGWREMATDDEDRQVRHIFLSFDQKLMRQLISASSFLSCFTESMQKTICRDTFIHPCVVSLSAKYF